MSKPFESDLAVPEVCPPELIIPDDERTRDLARPLPGGTVSPVELSWILFEGDGAYAGLHLLKENLLASVQIRIVREVHNEIRNCDYLNHVLRVVARVALDPRRQELFDLTKVYRLDRGIQFPSDYDREYLSHFAVTHGVVERGLVEQA